MGSSCKVKVIHLLNKIMIFFPLVIMESFSV